MEKPLDQELATYAREREHLEREHRDKFVLIHRDDVVGVYDTFDTAADEGIRRFGKEPFMVRQVGRDTTKLSPAVLYGLLHAGSSGDIREPGR